LELDLKVFDKIFLNISYAIIFFVILRLLYWSKRFKFNIRQLFRVIWS